MPKIDLEKRIINQFALVENTGQRIRLSLYTGDSDYPLSVYLTEDQARELSVCLINCATAVEITSSQRKQRGEHGTRKT